MADNKDAYNLRLIFEQIELDLIKSLKRTMKLHDKNEKKEGFEWEQWQQTKLRNIKEYSKFNNKIVRDKSTEIENLTNEIIEKSYKKGEKLFNNAIEYPEDISNVKSVKKYKVSKEKVKRPKEEIFFKINEKKMEALKKVVTNDLKDASKAALRKMDDVYRQTIYKAEINMSSGAKTLNQAIDMATKDFVQQGINCIEYKNGRRVNIASYAEMALRTASHRALLLGEGKKRDEWNIHTIIVTTHANTCSLCLPWQGKILVDDVFCQGTKKEAKKLSFPLLSEAMDLGLLHPNCRHTLSTYFPGITRPILEIDTEKATKLYDLEQKQRLIERQIRKWKRIAEGCIDKDNSNKANNKVIEWQNELRKHLKLNKELRRDCQREKIKDVEENKQIDRISSGVNNPKIIINKITDSAINKVSKIKIGDMTEKETIRLQEINKLLLKTAKTKNSSKEVAITMDDKMSIVDIVLGDEKEIELKVGPEVRFVVHNHPNNKSFSNQDINWFIQREKVKYFSIVKNNGEIEILLKNNDFNLKTFLVEYKRIIKKYEKDIAKNEKREYDRIIEKLLSMKNTGIERMR